MSDYSGGNGFVGGEPMYYEDRPDGGMDIFPGGLPRGHHSQMPHDHIITNADGGVEYMREGGQVINNYAG
jgi:hypothetical protein